MSFPTVSAGKVFDAILRARGLDPTTYNPVPKEVSQIEDLVNVELRTVMEAEFWPELMLTERRQYRPTYSAAQTYGMGKEVLDDPTADSPRYWRSLVAGNIGNPCVEGAFWTATLDKPAFIPYIEFRQSWETSVIDYSGIQLDDCAYHHDPLSWPNAAPIRDVKFWQQSLLIPTNNMPVLPYIRFRATVPEISYTAWDTSVSYAIGDVCYVDPVSYVAIQPSSATAPAASPGYWTAIGIPQTFFKYLQWQCSGMLTSEQEGRVRGEKLTLAATEMERLRHMFMQKSGERPSVRWRTRKPLRPIGVPSSGILGSARGYY